MLDFANMVKMRWLLVGVMVCACSSPSWAQTGGYDGPAEAKDGHPDLAKQIAALLADPMVARAHWGIDVTSMDGSPIYSMNEGQLFQPASNTKMFTTATALALMGPQATLETKVVARGKFNGAANLTGDVVLVGGGDANLSGREIPYVPPAMRPKIAPGQQPPPGPDALRYLQQMADEVAKTGLKVVNGNVIGDDTLYPWEPYAEDWSIDDSVWGYGAPVSALTVTDNQLALKVSPGTEPGQPAVVTLDPMVPYYTVDTTNLITSVASSGSHVQIERELGSKVLRIYGSIAVDAHPDEEEIAVHDPAEYAAAAFKQMLEARGILVTGVAEARHRPTVDSRSFMQAVREPLIGHDWKLYYGPVTRPQMCISCADPGVLLAKHVSPTLLDDITVTNKVSQNLHAELLLRAVGNVGSADGSIVNGARVVRDFLTTQAGIDPDDFVFFDGSGLSGHNLVAPRATAKLLGYATTQRWFADWKRTLPIGGEDGSLAERFPNTPLKDHVFAKTGTLGEARALSGYLDCASGKTVIFSIMVGNHIPRSNADREVMDKIVAAIAAAN